MIRKGNFKLTENMEGQESPLIQFWKQRKSVVAPSDAAVQFRERAFLGYLNLRGDPNDPVFLDSVRSILGCDLPVVPNTSKSFADLTVLWLGPDEWLIVTSRGDEERVSDALRRGLANQVFSLTDVTSGYTLLTLSGPRLQETLAKGCTIDLDAREFHVGNCVQTHIGKAIVAIWHSRVGSFELVVRRSFAEYLALWLEDAAREFGFTAIEDSLSHRGEKEVAVALQAQ